MAPPECKPLKYHYLLYNALSFQPLIYQPTRTFPLCQFWCEKFWILLRSRCSGSEGLSSSTSRSRGGRSARGRYCTPEPGAPRRIQSPGFPAFSSCLQRMIAGENRVVSCWLGSEATAARYSHLQLSLYTGCPVCLS